MVLVLGAEQGPALGVRWAEVPLCVPRCLRVPCTGVTALPGVLVQCVGPRSGVPGRRPGAVRVLRLHP